jgi:cytochrome o ubiquinol oxidase subunit 2
VLGLITWRGCHELDPFKPIPAENEMRIQVVALRWKWLFIYPDHHIATVNYFRFPKDTAVRFEITADAPMNSFWIPQLGGQIYAMPGMRSELNLIAHETGQFRGSSANISGKGFASMVFTAEAATNENFEEWVQIVRGSPKMLSDAEYDRLAEPSEYNPASFYVLDTDGLFDRIAMKYMVPMP